jgi:hypothetical protein
MNAILLTVLVLNGVGGGVTANSLDGPAVNAGTGAPCGGGHGHHPTVAECIHDWCGPMPQSCYNPSFGCYPSTRFMHRYPAFHNTYYRSAYNYRQYFDYPWHAGLHEPTSMFSYHVPGEGPGPAAPMPSMQGAKNMTPATVRAVAPAVAIQPANPLR